MRDGELKKEKFQSGRGKRTEQEKREEEKREEREKGPPFLWAAREERLNGW